MADGRRHWQRWLDQVIDSLGALPLYDLDYAWDPNILVGEPKESWREMAALTQRPSSKLRLHSSRSFGSKDGPTAA